jgi:hypothetical protein
MPSHRAEPPLGTNVRHLYWIIASLGTDMYAPVTLNFSKSHDPFLPSYLLSVSFLLPPSPSLILISSYSHLSLFFLQGFGSRAAGAVWRGQRPAGVIARGDQGWEIFLMLFLDVASSCSHVSCEFMIVSPICVWMRWDEWDVDEFVIVNPICAV